MRQSIPSAIQVFTNDTIINKKRPQKTSSPIAIGELGQVAIRKGRLRQSGFTLVELMVAMTITLLLMAVLGKAFAVIGQTMKKGRSQVTLSAKLRSLSFRMRSDLRNRTVEAKPITPGNKGGGGYITYYEGPLTEQTWGMFADDAFRFDKNSEVDSQMPAFASLDNNPTYRRYARYGDFDDYIAFTAKAPGDSWFTGKVPRYLVDDSVNVGVINEVNRMEPVVVRSKYAEIIIWAEPEYELDATNQNNLVFNPTTGMPNYKDVDNNYVPDSITLHQRILLIRPDLNVRGTIPASASAPAYETEYLRPVNGSVTNPAAVPAPLRFVYPIGNPFLTSPDSPYNPAYVATNSDTNPSRHFDSHWLVGMAPLHHFFDLSLRRLVNPITGEPTPFVAVNSLEDLTEPHNRFAAVRYPGRFFGYGAGTTDYATSMPLLAMAWNPAIVNWNTPDVRGATQPPWFPAGYPNWTSQNAAIRSPLFNGWLIPHFTLGDPNPGVTGTGRWQRNYLQTLDPRWDRTGEDVLASNVLAFDIKAFDPAAPVFLTAGLDDKPGKAGVDDDGSNSAAPDLSTVTTYSAGTPPSVINQVQTELGAVGSDDVIVGVGDLGIFPLLRERILDPRDADAYAATSSLLSGRHNQMIANKGDFVNLFFPYLPGGPMLDTAREMGPFPTTPSSTPPTSPTTTQLQMLSNLTSLIETDFSGYPIRVAQLSPLKSSGKLVHAGAGGGYRFFQPCFDTWTSGYESDGFDQTASLAGAISGTSGTVWVLNNWSSTTPIDRQARLPTPATVPAIFSVDTGKHDPTAPECLPPVLAELPAISITVRLSDPVGGEMSEITVIENLVD